jgi:hypothetical protein
MGKGDRHLAPVRPCLHDGAAARASVESRPWPNGAAWDENRRGPDRLRRTPATAPEGPRARLEFMAEDLLERGAPGALRADGAAFTDVFRAGPRGLRWSGAAPQEGGSSTPPLIASPTTSSS